MSPYWLILFLICSYFIGNVNFSVIISNQFLKRDIRSFQSNNPGTMNMIRNFGLKWGGLILMLDIAKGAVPALLGLLLLGDSFSHPYVALYACGFAAVVGHCFPVIYNFKGGKGVASTMGVFFVANPLVSTIVFICCAVYLAVFEYGAMMSFMFVTVMIIWQSLQIVNSSNLTICLFMFAYYFLMWYVHRANIYRLLLGRENQTKLLKKFKKRLAKDRQKRWMTEGDV